MKTVTFGEIMMRLSPPGYKRLCQTPAFDISFGGGEANVAVSLSQLGCDSKFITRLPDNDIGKACAAELNRYGVDTSGIIWGGERMGIYFCEKGASQRPSKVIYDRKGSSVSELAPGDINWDKAFVGADRFHFTGITPALGDGIAAALTEACKKAKSLGLTVSCDLNYRKKLWSKNKACQVMTPLMDYVDILIANEEDAADVFSIVSEKSNLLSGEIDRNGYISVASQLSSQFGMEMVCITLRESVSASVNNWSALLFRNNQAIFSNKYSINIVDRVGGGDSFSAGLIYSIINNKNDKDALNFAVAASCLKHTIEGDFNLVSAEEVNALVGGDGSGRVQR